MKSFSAFTSTSPTEQRFVGFGWEDAGFVCDEAGNPVRDCRGTPVARFSVTEIDARDADLIAVAYAGDGEIGDGDTFAHYLAGECGLPDSTIAAVCGRLGVAYSQESLSEYRRILALPPEDRITAAAQSRRL